jgi:hypothetical protein
MSQLNINEGTFSKLYNVAANMTPETRKLWLDAFNRAVEVEAQVEAELTKDRQQEYPDDTSELGGNIDYAIGILQQMKLTSKKGGSRKRSINCRRPRGFSQRQHCKYGRRGWKTTMTRRIKSKSTRD